MAPPVPPENEGDEAPREQADAEQLCGICLDATPPPLLRCGHRFCVPCLASLAHTKLHGPPFLRGALGCAICQLTLDAPTICRILATSEDDPRVVQLLAAGRQVAANTRPEGAPPAEAADAAAAAFRSWARREHARACPHCSAVIVKCGGCTQMRCALCYSAFHWREAALVCPCRGWHPSATACTGAVVCKENPHGLTRQERATLAVWQVGTVALLVPALYIKFHNRVKVPRKPAYLVRREQQQARRRELIQQFGPGMYIAQ